jgi:hypothetical protein
MIILVLELGTEIDWKLTLGAEQLLSREAS